MPINKIRKLSNAFFFFITGIVLVVIGIILLLNQKSDKTTATILSYDHENGSQFITVSFELNGEEVTARMTTYSGEPSVGGIIDISYDPDDPYEVSEASPFVLYSLFGIGGLLIVISIFVGIKAVITLKAMMKEAGDDMPDGFFASLKRSVNQYNGVNTDRNNPGQRAAENAFEGQASNSEGAKTLHFYAESGSYLTYGSLETPDGEVLYEAFCRNHRLLTADDYEFYNHVTGKKTMHKVGKSATIGDGRDFRDKSFLYDGKNVWDILERNGGLDISMDMTLNGRFGINFTVTKHGQPFAKLDGVGFSRDDRPLDRKTLAFKIQTDIGDEDIGLLFLATFAIGHG